MPPNFERDPYDENPESRTSLWNLLRSYTQESQPLPGGPQHDSQEGEAPLPTQQEIETSLASYAERFEDPTYVPTIEEFEEMEQFAEQHINVVLPRRGDFQESVRLAGKFLLKDDTDRLRMPMRYMTKNTAEKGKDKKLNPHMTRFFLDGINEDRWRLSDNEQRYAEAIKSKSPRQLNEINGGDPKPAGRVLEPRQIKSDLLTWSEFWPLMASSKPRRTLVGDYKDYVEARFKLEVKLWERNPN